MSINHQYIQYTDQVKKRYVKTVPYMVSGLRLDPSDTSHRIDFLLSTPESRFDFDKKELKGDFVYDDDVLELYSDVEVRLFERLNKPLIENGLLKEYIGSPEGVSTDNFLSDEDVEEIVRIKLPNTLRKRISSITSSISINRCLIRAKELGRSYSIIKILQERLAELND